MYCRAFSYFTTEDSNSRCSCFWGEGQILDTASKRATCNRGRSGCVIVRDKQVLATEYVGSPTGLPHCDDAGHQMKTVIQEDGKITEHCLHTVHSKQNAICQAAKRGIAIAGAAVYTRMTPCRTCAMLLINCGIQRVVVERKHQLSEETEMTFAEAGVKLELLHDEIRPYESQ